MKALIALIGLFSLVPAVLPAHAQATSNSEKALPPVKRDAKVIGAEEMYDVAHCVVDRKKTLSARLLEVRPASRDEDRINRALTGAFEGCMTGYVDSMNAGTQEFRGFLAEVYYFRSYPKDPDFSQLSHTEVPLPETWTTAKLSLQERSVLYVHQSASCVVAADPTAVLALLKTKVRSAEERAAAKAVAPRYGACLDQTKQLRIDPAMMRAYLAEHLYRSIKAWKPLQVPAAPVEQGK